MSLLRHSLQCCAFKNLYYYSFKPCLSNTRKITMGLYRLCSSEALATPAPDGCEKSYPPKIKQIVEQISKLTLIEAADLNECLQKTFKIKDMPMTMGAMPMTAAAAPAEEEAPQVTKSSFTVKLTSFDPAKKVSVIKEIKNVVEGLNLVQAKKFVEGVPQLVKADIGKDEAEQLKKALEAVGGVCEIS